MKKTTTRKLLVLFMALSFSGLWAGNFVVSGALDPNENGIYSQSGTVNGLPYYTTSNGSYILAWSGSEWDLGQGSGGFVFFPDCYSTVVSTTPPSTGWSCAGLVVMPQTDNLTYSSNQLVESISNNGTLPDTIKIALTAISKGQGLVGANGTDYATNGTINFFRVPAGLTAHAIKKDTSVSVYFSGTAFNSNHSNDIYIIVRFTNNAFALDTASNVINNIDSIQVLFRQQYQVAPIGGDFTSITAAVAAASDYDVINVASGTYTESNINVNTMVSIIGSCAQSTIVQAASSYNTATANVFTINANNVLLRGLTIQYGKNTYITPGTNNYVYGGGVDVVGGNATIDQCTITQNIAENLGSYGAAYGGGIYAGSNITISNCLITNNVTHTTAANAVASGIALTASSLVINSTIAYNVDSTTSSGYGAIANGPVSGPSISVINSTIYGNRVTSLAGGEANGLSWNGGIDLENTILYNNGSADANFYPIYGLTMKSLIAGNIIYSGNDAIDSAKIWHVNPLLDSLGNYGGCTKTMALLPGSPAINSGVVDAQTPVTDQRGYYKDGLRDIGAFEFNGHNCFPSLITNPVTLCQGLSYSINGKSYHVAGTYKDTLTSIGGCDSIVVTILSVNTLPVVSITGNVIGGKVLLGNIDTLTVTATGNQPFNYSWNTSSKADTALVTGNGTYTVTVTDNNNCSATATLLVTFGPNGIANIGGQNSTAVYPNPASSSLNLTFNMTSLDQSAVIQIIDITGRIISSQVQTIGNGKTTVLDIASMQQGIYFVTIQSAGLPTQKLRFVKQ